LSHLRQYLGNIIEDGGVVNAHVHAKVEGTPIYIVVDEMFRAWFLDHFKQSVSLGSCIQICKAMQGHPSVGSWWSDFFDRQCATPLIMRPAFTEPIIYLRDNSDISGPTLMIRQVDDIMASTAHASGCKAVLEGIASHIIFKISTKPTSLLYAMDI
jgi:hypothetical protein